MTATEQGTLLGSTCRDCGAAIPYCGHGRRRSLCDSCYPAAFPPRKSPTNVPSAVSGDVRGMVRATDPQTSRDAAALANITAGTLRAKCLLALVEAGANGLTDFELGARVGRQQTSAGKRRGELVEAGFVENTHEKRPSPSKAFAAVWRATPEGIARARELRDDT